MRRDPSLIAKVSALDPLGTFNASDRIIAVSPDRAGVRPEIVAPFERQGVTDHTVEATPFEGALCP
jgi:hypothetical protein